MKVTLFALSLLMYVVLFPSCGDTDEEDTYGKNDAGDYIDGSIIDKFYEPDTLQVSFWSPSQGCDATEFYLYLARIDSNGKFKGNYWTSISEKGKNYVEYYGDTTFSGWINFSAERYYVSAMPLNSISVTADKDFDVEHPAGSSLNDVFTLEYASAYNLIQSNYNPDLNIFQWGDYQRTPLAEFKPLLLPCFRMYLIFNKLPEKLGAYQFTITYEYGKDPVSGKEVKVAPAVVTAEFTEKDYVVKN